MHVNEPSTPTPARAILAGRGRTLTMVGFAVFAAFMLPLVICAIGGSRINAVLWVIPFVIPFGLEILRRMSLPALTAEEARQAADISRWEV